MVMQLSKDRHACNEVSGMQCKLQVLRWLTLASTVEAAMHAITDSRNNNCVIMEALLQQDVQTGRPDLNNPDQWNT